VPHFLLDTLPVLFDVLLIETLPFLLGQLALGNIEDRPDDRRFSFVIDLSCGHQHPAFSPSFLRILNSYWGGGWLPAAGCGRGR
jgi:hypothetical protein